MAEMQKVLFWDFDGTIYPIDPYDSEQFTLLSVRPYLSWIGKIRVSIGVWLDLKQLFSRNFKQFYLSILMNRNIEYVDDTIDYVAAKISREEQKMFRILQQAGWRQYIISCGTHDIITGVLDRLGLSDCFSGIYANKLTTSNGNITGITIHVKNGSAKTAIAAHITSELLENHDQVVTAAVGDGYTDLPLMAFADHAYLVSWGNSYAEMKDSRKISETIITVNSPVEAAEAVLNLESI